MTTAPHFKKAHEASAIRKPLSDHNPSGLPCTVEPIKPGAAAYGITEKIQGIIIISLTSKLVLKLRI